MAYAETTHVRASAGKVSSYWREDTRPNDADLETFLVDGDALVDAALGARGVSVPVDSSLAGALRPVVTDYALVRAIDATFPGGAPSDEVAALRAGADARWNAWLTSVADGSNSIVDVLVTGPGAPLATSFWQEEPDYGRVGAERHVGDDNFRLAPYVTRGEGF